MSTLTSGASRLSKWVLVSIILAVALLSSCLIISLMVSYTFQQEVSRVMQSLPAGSFYITIRNENVDSLARDIAQIPKLIDGVASVARLKPPVRTPRFTRTQNQVTTVVYEHLGYQGVTPEFFAIRQLPLADGRYFDVADTGNVAVIGADFAAFWGYRVGSMVQSDFFPENYEVVGILQQTDAELTSYYNYPQEQFVSDTVFVPVDRLPTLRSPNPNHPIDFSSTIKVLKTTNLILVTGDDQTTMDVVMDDVQAYLKKLPGTRVAAPHKTPNSNALLEYVGARTTKSLEQMGIIVIVVGALSISGLMLMHVLLGVKVIGIKRSLGATRDRLIWENLWRYSLLSFCGFLVSLLLVQPLLPLVSDFLGAELQISSRTLLYAMLGVTLLAPLCGLIPTAEASQVSPLDAIRGHLRWGVGKKRLDLRQLVVALAFAAAVGTMFLVSQIGYSTLSGIDASLRAIGRDMLLVEEPPAGAVASIPKLSEADDASLCVTCLEPYGETAWMAQTRLPVGLATDALTRTSVLAVKRDVPAVRNYRLADGNWLTGARQAVIGSDLAYALFRGQSPLGETILLGNSSNPFTIVGVLEPRALYLADFDFDRNNAVFINWSDHSLAAATAQFEPRIFFRAKTPSAVIPAQNVIKRLLKESNTNAELLVVRNPLGDLEESKRLTETFNLSSSIMALVTVVTACASVAALTLIQAREMQKVLALRRACGATKREVLTIILREVLTLIIIGAAVGLVVAQIGFQEWARINELPSASSWGTVLIGLAVSFAIAILSAVWPAWYVARQAPAELLD